MLGMPELNFAQCAQEEPMSKFYLSGLIVLLGLSGAAVAQTPAKFQRPAFVPNKPAVASGDAVRQVKAEAAPVALPAMTPPMISAPALSVAPANTPTPAFMADVNAACGEQSMLGGCDSLCGPPGRFWIGGEYLLWQTKGNFLPALATGSPAGSAQSVAGTLGGPGTTTLIGNRDYANDWRSGFRLYGGAWLNARQTLGIEGDWFFLGDSSSREVAASNGTQIVTRPFINTTRRNADGTFTQVAPFQDTQLVSFPNILSGQVAVNTNSQFFGGGANLLANLLCGECSRLDAIVGWRYLNLTDTLNIREDLTGLPGSQNPGATFVVQDNFSTTNQFNGVNLGLAHERRFGSFFVATRASVALGNTNTIVDINGNTAITPAGGPTTNFAGGLLTQPSNIGRYELNKFATVTEVGAKLGAQVTDHLRVYAGYNFIYWSDVIRTGNVIDLRVNGSQIAPRLNQTGPLFPRFEPKYTDFLAHGIVIGAQLRY